MNLHIYDIINAITEIWGAPEFGDHGHFRWGGNSHYYNIYGRRLDYIEMAVRRDGFVSVDITDAFRFSTYDDRCWHISGLDRSTDSLNQTLMNSIPFRLNKKSMINQISKDLVFEQIKTMAIIVKNTHLEPKI